MKSPEQTDRHATPRIREIFDIAVLISKEQQIDFVARACSEDEDLKRAVLELLEADRLGPLPAAVELEARAMARTLFVSYTARTFGAYRTTRCIGAGGMGAVFQAVRQDDEYQKTVAIKVLPGGLESELGIERFRRERQILANLDHPNIARLLDGGTTIDGLPFLVMEFVEGIPLDQYAMKANSGQEARLQLFVRICDAVAYAHRGLVVHCDLKPSNILVTGDGTPKLLDFGIAKLLDEVRGSSTATSPMMTPEFASPEQVRGERITTTSDVYSLGVLLYVLLTGNRPYQTESGSVSEMVRLVCEQVIDVRSAVDLAPDLRSIIAMATHKDASRRYGSVEQLAADIERYRSKQPVIARRGDFIYRASKFVRRNRVILAATAICVLAVTLGVSSSWSQSRRAERRFNELRGLARFLVFDTYEGITKLPGSTSLRYKVLAKAQQYLDSLAQEAGGDPALNRELVESYLRLGAAQGDLYVANLGDTAGALATYKKAEVILEQLIRTDRSPELQAQICNLYWKQSMLLTRTRRLDEAVEALERAEHVATELHRHFPDDSGHLYLRGSSRLLLGYVVFQRADERHSGPDLQTSIEIVGRGVEDLRHGMKVHAKASPNTPALEWEHTLSMALFYQSYAHWRLGDLSGDLDHFRKALDLQQSAAAIVRRLAAGNPQNRRYKRTAADNLNEIGYTLNKLGRFAEAEGTFRDSIARFEELAAEDPSNAEARKDIADACRYYAISLLTSGRKADAVSYSRRAAAIYKDALGHDPRNREIQQALNELKVVGQ